VKEFCIFVIAVSVKIDSNWGMIQKLLMKTHTSAGCDCWNSVSHRTPRGCIDQQMGKQGFLLWIGMLCMWAHLQPQPRISLSFQGSTSMPWAVPSKLSSLLWTECC